MGPYDMAITEKCQKLTVIGDRNTPNSTDLRHKFMDVLEKDKLVHFSA